MRGRRVEAALIAHMAEVDRRRLYRGEACSSMFAYATERLRLSESQAYDRITVARTARRFPVLLEMIADGRLTLTAAAKLGPHLTGENAAGLLERAVHATRRQVEALVAELAPRPDVPPSIRKLPAPRAWPAAPIAEAAPARPADPAPIEEAAPARPAEPPGRAAGVRPAGPAPTAAGRVVASAPDRFRVQFTASAELEQKIARARALLRHTIPSGDLAAIVDRAMTLLVAKLERTRCGATDRPRTSAPSASTSRDVPAATVRAVWQRDQGRCTFVDREGRRCAAREWLEIHHDAPFGRGGPTSLANLRLLCRAHNAHEAEREFGAAHIAAHIAARIAARRAASAAGKEQLSLPGHVT